MLTKLEVKLRGDLPEMSKVILISKGFGTILSFMVKEIKYSENIIIFYINIT